MRGKKGGKKNPRAKIHYLVGSSFPKKIVVTVAAPTNHLNAIREPRGR